MATWQLHNDTFKKFGSGPLEFRLSDRAEALVLNIQPDGTFTLDDVAAADFPLHAIAQLLPLKKS